MFLPLLKCSSLPIAASGMVRHATSHNSNHRFIDVHVPSTVAATVIASPPVMGSGGGSSSTTTTTTATASASGNGGSSGHYTSTAAISPFYLTAASHSGPAQPSASASAASYFSSSPSESRARIELQRQSIKERRKRSDGLTVRDKIPGYTTSAAFLGSLRTNLRLNVSPPPSPLDTPPSMRSSVTSLPPPSPLATPVDSVMDEPVNHHSASSASNGASVLSSTTTTTGTTTPAHSPTSHDPLAGVPDLHSYLASSDEDKAAALKLIADSIAQMRQTANRALIFNPANMATVIAALGLLARYMMSFARNDILITGTACACLLIGFFALCRFLTQGYLSQAEKINWAWLEGSEDGSSSVGPTDVLVTKFGDEIIGALVIEWVSGESSRSKRKKAWRGEIRAWTVRLKYRGKGVGTALIEDAVALARRKGAEKIEFADDHANSERILPSFFNAKFDDRERTARQALEDLWLSSPTRSKKK